MTELPKRYNHKDREPYWQQYWQEQGTYHWQGNATRDNTYVIDTPPPTVSGVLHMGHIFSYTHADFIARYQRMKGKDVFYPMGFDDNGLPTERLVEKLRKKRASDYDSREAFIEVCQEVSQEARLEFRKLFTSTALSVDWRQEYHTISDDVRRLSQQSFLDLHGNGHIYRKLRPTLWDPVDQTAIAQAEVEDKELEGSFNDIRFAVDDSDESFVIGTTRPELLPACVGIFYHPDDARYQHLKGQSAITPLFGVRVPVLEDDTVEPDKGTGIMMCCTFGDEADIEKWQKHDLETRIIVNQYGKLYDVSDALNGLRVKAARAAIIDMLRDSGDLVQSTPITHAVPCAERSGAPLEILPTMQWYVNISDCKDALKTQSKACNWNPAWMEKRMEQWIDGINQDWCISRQRYYGVPFPAWYSKRAGEEGKLLLAEPDQLPVNPLIDLPKGYTADEVEPDADVMDTWATSSLSPHINAQGITSDITDDTTRFDALYPADLRPQAHEIIRSWAFYTLAKSYLHNNQVPWHNLMISGWCLASDKTKMSKSKGNVVTPVALIEEKGTDAVRYWASTAKLGTDTAFSEDLLKIGNKLVTKLWNASKFAALHLEHIDTPSMTAAEAVEQGLITEPLDRWILSITNVVIFQYNIAFHIYDYAGARNIAEQLFWNGFCDNYLELVKSRAYGNMGQAAQRSACYTIWYVLNVLLKLFAPFVPHITEELYSNIYPQEYAKYGSIHARGTMPQPEDQNFPFHLESRDIGRNTVAILELIRKAKSDKGLSIKYPIDKLSVTGITANSLPADLAAAGNVGHIEYTDSISADTLQLSYDDDAIAIGVTFADQPDVA